MKSETLTRFVGSFADNGCAQRVRMLQLMKEVKIDFSLITQARRFINAANVHQINTWIFCYEMSSPESERRKRYERLLVKFVGTESHRLAVRN